MSPAPSRERREPAPEDRELRTDTDRPPGVPAMDLDSRPETERRDTWEREVEREVEAEVADRAEGTLPPPADRPAAADGWDPAEPSDSAPADWVTATTGASPQVSQ
jgi:hypothetical protein